MNEPNSNTSPLDPEKQASGQDCEQTQVPQPPRSQDVPADQPLLDETGRFECVPSTDATTDFDSKTKLDRPAGAESKSAPQKIGGYQIGVLLGQGGMGRVYRAEDSSGGLVAIKLLSPNLSSSADALARFKQEGLIASQINHPHIVFVHRVDEADGIPFIAMELMTGKTLKDLVYQNGPLPLDHAVRLILQCIDGLLEAHSRGMIHRDVKPANCYLDEDGSVKVGDFGLARSLISDSELTQTGAFLGTPLFASPEQLLGQKIDLRSDIYSLSATLYYLLAGRAPFESPNAAQVIARIASSDPPSFKTAEVEVPKALEDIVMKGLSRDTAKRYQTFAEMRDDLLKLLAPEPERASFFRRLGAGLADWFIVSTGFGLMLFTLVPVVTEQPFTSDLLTFPFVLLYYWICESLLGTSLGKGALSIQVVDLHTGVRPTVWRCFQRSCAHSLVASGASMLAILAINFFGIKNVFGVVGLQWSSALFGYALNLFGWYYFKERLFFFDWLSGTACQIIPAVQVPLTHLELPTWKPASLEPSRPLTSSFGRFRITRELEPFTKRPEIRWFEGVDPQLEREIWVILSSDPSIEVEEIQRSKPKWNRVRFIEEGTHELGRWFAYVSPEGMPLDHCVSSGVQLSWPQTKSVMSQLASMASMGRQANQELPSKSRIWVDRAGRLCVADWDAGTRATNLPPSAADRDPVSMAFLEFDLVRVVASLALSPHHRYRRRRLSQKARNSHLPVQALMPLRARKLCESLAAAKSVMPIERVLLDFQEASRGAAFITTKSRFFNATLSAAFLIPVMVSVWFMLIGPSLIYYGNVTESLQSAKTLLAMSQRDNVDPANWEGATPEQKAYLLSPEGKNKLSELASVLDQRLKRSFDNFGVIEQTVWRQIPLSGTSPTEPSEFHLIGDPSVPIQKNNNPNQGLGMIKIGRREIPLVEQLKWNPRHLQRGLELVDGKINNAEFFGSKEFPIQIVWWMLSACIVWTWLTFGGFSQYLSGICFVRLDGQKIGLVRSLARAIVLYLPVLVLVYLISNWSLVNENDIFWTTQLKRLLGVAPLIYLATTLLKSNRTPLDRLTGTAAVPR
jgi:hypothetical protein